MGELTDALAKSDPAEFRDQLRDYLRERRSDGYRYVTSTDVCEEFDVTGQRAGKNLAILYQNGDLSLWNDPDTNGSNTYLIEVGEDASD